MDRPLAFGDQPVPGGNGGNALPPLPPLREDLQLIQCAPDRDGQPVFRINDPIAQRFFEVSAQTKDLLAHWQAGTASDMQQQVRAKTGRTVPDEEVADLISFVQQNDLVQPSAGETSARLNRRYESTRQSFMHKLVHSYLFFKLPLARPHRFLSFTMPIVSLMFNRFFAALICLIGLTGLYFTSRQWDTFLATFPDRFDTAWVITVAVSLTFIKILHELGHAYTATYLGSRVGSIGVAFIVLWPVMYTETTDAWRLSSRRERTLIDGAGILVELSVAACATFAWAFLPDGAMRSIAFTLATTSWVLSLAINLNPLMRFDGYFLLADSLGISNLQARSFEMGRWHLREWLFGLGEAMPESCGLRRRWFYIAFAWSVWVYRLLLFIGIALLVYHMFFKVLGIILFVVEIGWFVAIPIWREFKIWWSMRTRITKTNRTRFTAAGIVCLLALTMVPFDTTVRLPVVVGASAQFAVHSSRPAQIRKIAVKLNDTVTAGQVLFELENPELLTAREAARLRADLLTARLARRTGDIEDRAQSLVLQSELQRETQNIEGLDKQIEQLVVRAPIAGQVAQLPIDLHEGRWVDTGLQLALVVSQDSPTARGYLHADDLGRLAVGATGTLRNLEGRHDETVVTVQRIGAAAAATIEHVELASVYGGQLASYQDGQKLRPDQPVFELFAQLDTDSVNTVSETLGELRLEAKPQSAATIIWRQLAKVAIRETSL